jgi:Hypothetical glycosyl hydrolase family 15
MFGGHHLGDVLRRGLALAVCSVAIAAAGSHAGSATAASPQPSTAALRVCSGCSKSWTPDGSRYRYVILHTWQASVIPTLKAENPSIKVLVYKDTEVTVAYACHDGVDDTYLPAGIGYCWANKNRPGWFLTDTSGGRIEVADYPNDWLMDVGNVDYQKQWVQNVKTDAKALGFDGVYLDDVNDGGQMHWHLGTKTMAKYPTVDSWTRATTSFMARVGPELKAAGLLVLPNIAISDWWKTSGLSTWDTWVSYSSGGVQQYYTKWGSGSSQWFTDDGGWHNNWSYRQAFLQHTQAAGKIFLGSTFAPADDFHSMRYARASFLADWDGGRSALIFQPTYPDAQDPYSPVWTADIGTPLGPRYKVGVAWRRDYTGGTTIVNPSPTSAQTIALGRTYTTSGGSAVSSVTVGATDGIILSAAASPPPPPPPAPPPPGATAPVNTSLPKITIQRGGNLLSGSVGTWTGTPTSFAYLWLRCDSNGANCVPIGGATAQTYSVTSQDAGFRIRFRVTASNAAGSGRATSQPTSVVTTSNGGKLRKAAVVAQSATLLLRASGAIRTRRGLQWFTVRPTRRSVRVRYFDPRGRLAFRSTKITRVRVGQNHVIVGGRGTAKASKHRRGVWFSVRIVDRGRGGRVDRFRIALSTGYHRKAHLAKGNITIR